MGLLFKVLKNIALLQGNPSLGYGASPATWDHSVTCHPTQVKAPNLNSAAEQADTAFIYATSDGQRAELTWVAG